jgi:NTE family protein
MEKKKITTGYALGGGLACGLFHIGVLSVLEENNITPDCIAGTSMGAIIGALYASGLSIQEIKQMAMKLNWKQLVSLSDISLPLFDGLIRGKRVVSLLKSALRDMTFDTMKIKFACVATDVMTGEQVVLQNGSLIEAIRASISLPAIFTPVKINGRYLMDGGLSNVVPVSVCRDMGAQFVFGVNVIPRPSENFSILDSCEQYYDYHMHLTGTKSIFKSPDNEARQSGPSLKKFGRSINNLLFNRTSHRQKKINSSWTTIIDGKPVALFYKKPNLPYLVSQTLSIVEYRIAIENLKEADIAITPFNGNIGFTQFHRVKDAINAGEIATRLTMEREDIARTMLNRQLSLNP